MPGLRIGVVSDTHLLEQPVPDEVLRAFDGVDLILHAGDILELPVIERLSQLAETIAVRGNMDHGDVARALPEKRIVEVGGFKIGLTHGHGPPLDILSRVSREFTSVDCVVFGHTHNPVVKHEEGVLFFNPGSPTDKMFAEKNTLGFLDITDKISGRIVEL